jgi:hypothetical protein
MPLNAYRIILAEFDSFMPELEVDVRWPEGDLDAVFYAVVFFARVPPVAVFELEE